MNGTGRNQSGTSLGTRAKSLIPYSGTTGTSTTLTHTWTQWITAYIKLQNIPVPWFHWFQRSHLERDAAL